MTPPSRNFPVLTVAAVAAAVMVQSNPRLRALAGYDRDAILAGEVWRLFTGHWVHFSGNHLLLDCLALGFAGVFVESRAQRLWLLFVAVVPWCVGVGLLSLDPALAVYGGLSGLAAGAMVLTGLLLWREGGAARWISGFLVGLVVAKLLTEATGMASFARLPDGVTVSALSHRLGVLGALTVFVVPLQHRPYKRPAVQ